MRQTVLNLCLLATLAVTTVLGANSWAKATTPPPQTQDEFTVESVYDPSSHELNLKVTEIAQHPAACDLVLTGLTYSADTRILSIKLEPDFCQLDIMGNRKASVKWTLPINLRAGADFLIQINNNAVGSMTLDPNGAALLKQ